jgi:hypothetical protein
MLSVEFKPPDFRGIQRYNGGLVKRFAVVGKGSVQPLNLCSFLKRKADEHASTHPVECVVREKGIV